MNLTGSAKTGLAYLHIQFYGFENTTHFVGKLQNRSEVMSHLLTTYTLATRMLDTLSSITLKWYNTQELTHSKILTYNHVQKTKSKFKSLGMFPQDLLLKPYAML